MKEKTEARRKKEKRGEGGQVTFLVNADQVMHIFDKKKKCPCPRIADDW